MAQPPIRSARMGEEPSRFADRSEAGRLLAARLATMALPDPVVYALPRGGVPVALEIARALGAPLDLVLVRKIGAPGSPELALAAVVDGERPETVLNDDVRRATGADDAYVDAARRRALQELERRRGLYLAGRPRIDPSGRSAIIVDDGLATGATAKAALNALRRRGPAHMLLAVPVAPRDRLAEVMRHADAVVCLRSPVRFGGVGEHYEDFHQLTDAETVALLRLW